MADLTTNDVPEELTRELQQLAPHEGKGLTREVVSSGEEIVPERQVRNGESKLESVRAFVAGHDGKPLTPELIEEAINTGRP